MHLDMYLSVSQENTGAAMERHLWQKEEVVIGFVFSVYLCHIIALLNGSLGYSHSVFKSGTL